MATPEQGARAIRTLRSELERTEPLANAYAEAILDEAQRRASGKPSPQSRLVADAMSVNGPTLVLTGGVPAEVYGGAEWGSSIYTQFAPRNEGGYWLHPAAEDPDIADRAAGEWMDDALNRTVRGF